MDCAILPDPCVVFGQPNSNVLSSHSLLLYCCYIVCTTIYSSNHQNILDLGCNMLLLILMLSNFIGSGCMLIVNLPTRVAIYTLIG